MRLLPLLRLCVLIGIMSVAGIAQAQQIPISHWPVPTTGSTSLQNGDIVPATRSGVTYALRFGLGFTCATNQFLTQITSTGSGVCSALPAAGAAAAGTLTGTFLAANVVSSSLTSLGTLSSLTVSGNEQAGSISIGSTSAHTGAVIDLGSTTSSAILSSGTTAQRPGSPMNGMLRYNSSLGTLDSYVNNAWAPLGGYIQPSATSATFTKTSSAALATVTGLSANLAAGKTYTYEMVLYLTAGATGGVQVDLAGGTATATSLISEGQLNAGNTATNNTRSSTLATVMCSAAGATVYTCLINGSIVTNAAGTFAPRFAQNTSNGTPSTVVIGSYMKVTQAN